MKKLFLWLIMALLAGFSCLIYFKPALLQDMFKPDEIQQPPLIEPSPPAVVPPPAAQSALPDGFVYLSDVVPNMISEIRYFTAYNFVGAPIDGYEKPLAIMSAEGANALKLASDALYKQGYIVKIFDAYRPQRAVDHFVRWASDIEDTKYKYIFYPDVDKSQLFKGYISKKSGHTRGSTVDLTIVDMATGKEVDMGCPFDFLGTAAGAHAQITDIQRANRQILETAMSNAGFKPYSKEWWHFVLLDEPYPDTYFDFPVA